jgi:hypothetical protein
LFLRWGPPALVQLILLVRRLEPVKGQLVLFLHRQALEAEKPVLGAT